MAKLESRIYEIKGKRLTLELPNKEWVVIGRAANGDTFRPDVEIQGNNYISRKHCAIYQQNEGYKIEDLVSTHGTFVNDHKIMPGEKYPIVNKDEIRLGDERNGECYLFLC